VGGCMGVNCYQGACQLVQGPTPRTIITVRFKCYISSPHRTVIVNRRTVRVVSHREVVPSFAAFFLEVRDFVTERRQLWSCSEAPLLPRCLPERLLLVVR